MKAVIKTNRYPYLSGYIKKSINNRWNFIWFMLDIFLGVFRKIEDAVSKTPFDAVSKNKGRFFLYLLKKALYLGITSSLLSRLMLSLNSISGMEYPLCTLEISSISLLKPANFSFTAALSLSFSFSPWTNGSSDSMWFKSLFQLKHDKEKNVLNHEDPIYHWE